MTLLDNYQASIIDGAKGNLFRLQFANRAMGRDDLPADAQAAEREDRQSR
jgi:hypothetical protein